ncbi:hypothetical protein HK102_001070, partial [Quaeritorhiza haematococci]
MGICFSCLRSSAADKDEERAPGPSAVAISTVETSEAPKPLGHLDADTGEVTDAAGHVVYKLKPLDLVLFNGKDPVAALIRKIEKSWVKPDAMKPFTPLWTHAGILVDKTVLPLPQLEDGKLYLYESIFTGEILGYTYSKVFPVDHPKAIERGRHAGPQIRDFEAVLDEANADVGICPLSDEELERVRKELDLQKTVLQFHHKYKHYTYPFSIVPQLAAASDELYDWVTSIKEKWLPDSDSEDEDEDVSKPKERGIISAEDKKKKKEEKAKSGAVFCSELAALLYENLGITGFAKGTAAKFTPVEVEAAEAFKETIYVKANGEVYLADDKRTVTKRVVPEQILQQTAASDAPAKNLEEEAPTSIMSTKSTNPVHLCISVPFHATARNRVRRSGGLQFQKLTDCDWLKRIDADEKNLEVEKDQTPNLSSQTSSIIDALEPTSFASSLFEYREHDLTCGVAFYPFVTPANEQMSTLNSVDLLPSDSEDEDFIPTGEHDSDEDNSDADEAAGNGEGAAENGKDKGRGKGRGKGKGRAMGTTRKRKKKGDDAENVKRLRQAVLRLDDEDEPTIPPSTSKFNNGSTSSAGDMQDMDDGGVQTPMDGIEESSAGSELLPVRESPEDVHKKRIDELWESIKVEAKEQRKPISYLEAMKSAETAKKRANNKTYQFAGQQF